MADTQTQAAPNPMGEQKNLRRLSRNINSSRKLTPPPPPPQEGEAGGTNTSSNGSDAPSTFKKIAARGKKGKLAGLPGALPPPPPMPEEAPTVTPYSFDEPDTEDKIVFTESSSGDPQKPDVKGGTLEKLVERLTYDKYPDPEYLAAFLLTYRSFTTPETLLDLLIMRFNMPPPKGYTPEQIEEWKNNKLIAIRLRVVNAFRTWVNTFTYDFQDNQALVDKLQDFIQKQMANGGPGMDKAATQLIALLNKKLEGMKGTDKEKMFRDPPPKSIVPTVSPGALTILDIDVTEAARQLTLIEHELFLNIKPWECLNQAWMKANKNIKAPNIIKMIDRFNQVSRWIATEIVKREDYKERCDVLSHIIKIANKCCELKNFNAVMEIISGLQSSSVYRLKHTWGALSSKQQKRYEELESLMSRERNFQNFRTFIHRIEPPCIPYLGVYLTDLTFIEEGNPDNLPGGLINFVKRRKVSKIINELVQYQQTPYNLAAVPILRDYFCNLSYLEENDCYKMSLLREEKGAAAPKSVKKPSASPGSGSPASSGSWAAASKPTAAPAAGPLAAKKDDDDDIELELPEGYPFFQKDTRDTIVMSTEEGGQNVAIVAGTLAKVVERLTYDKWPDPSLVQDFLASYRSFASGKQVLDLLIARYKVPKPKSTAADVLTKFQSKRELPIQLRVFNVLKTWVERYFVDFEQDKPLLDRLVKFLQEDMKDSSMEKAGAQLLQTVLKLQAEGPAAVNPLVSTAGGGARSEPPMPHLPVNLKGEPKITDLHPEEVVRQLALMDVDVFAQVKLPEALFSDWWKVPLDQLKDKAPSLAALVARGERIRNWVATECVKEKNPEARSRIIAHFVEIAGKCLQPNLQQFNAFASIVTALLSFPVSRHKESWNLLKTKTLEQIEEFRMLSKSSFKRLCERMIKAQPPYIPYVVGVHNELSTIERTEEDTIDKDLINFAKRRKIAKLLQVVLPNNMQTKNAYLLEPVAFIQDWLNTAEVWSDDQLMATTTAGPSSPALASSPFAPASNSPNLARVRSSSNVRDTAFDDRRGSSETPQPSIGSRRSGSGSDSDLTIDDSASLKLKLLSFIMDDKDFRTQLKELFAEVVQDSLAKQHEAMKEAMATSGPPLASAEVAALKQELADLRQIVAAFGAQFAKSANEHETVLRRRFSNCEVFEWRHHDVKGAVYGWPEEVSIRGVKQPDGTVVLVDIRPTVDKADVATLLRVGELWSATNNNKPCKLAILSPSVTPQGKDIATANKVQILQ